MRDGDGHAQLPVRLAVQLIGAYEARAGRLARLEQHHVGGHALILLDDDDVGDFELGAGDELDAVVGEYLVLGRVDLLVASVALEVVVGLAHHRHRDHERQRAPIRVQVADAQRRIELRARHHQEVQVQEDRELLIQHLF